MKAPPHDDLFVIGDIHGCATELRLLLNELPLVSNSKVIFLGDYIDRGPDSRSVIETIIELEKKVTVIPLVGNHEQMFLSFLEDPNTEEGGMFIYNGGSATLESYRTGSEDFLVPEEHLNFFKDLKVAHQESDYFFVHAGVPEKALDKIDFNQDLNTLLWVREPFLSSQYDWGATIVHGHTPVEKVETLKNRINLDTGCVFDRRLSAVGLPSMRVYSVAKQSETYPIFLKEVDSNRIAKRFKGRIPVFAFKDNRTFEFMTVDFNEFGLFMKDLSGEEFVHYPEGQFIEGMIGSHGYNQAEFSGKIVRVEKKDDGLYYAVQMNERVQVKVVPKK